jgi:hypothetical protein
MLNLYIATIQTQKGEAREFDPGTSSPICALTNMPKPIGHRPYIVTNTKKYILNVNSSQPEGGVHTVRPLGHRKWCSLVINAGCKEGMETETNLFLGLGVPESDRGMETVIFG